MSTTIDFKGRKETVVTVASNSQFEYEPMQYNIEQDGNPAGLETSEASEGKGGSDEQFP